MEKKCNLLTEKIQEKAYTQLIQKFGKMQLELKIN